MGASQTVLGPLRQPVDLARFAGKWYEVARSRDIWFEPPGTTDVRATYTVNAGGQLDVYNEALLNGRPVSWSTSTVRSLNPYNSSFLFKITPPVAQFKSGGPALMGPPTPQAEYNILDLDMDAYTWAVVASSGEQPFVWILAREPYLDDALFLELLHRLDAYQGVDPRTLLRTQHTQGPEPPSDGPNRAVETAPTAGGFVLRRRIDV